MGDKISFKIIKVKDLEGNVTEFDLSKKLGNYLYKVTGDLGMLKVAQTIYDKGEVALNEEIRKELLKALNSPMCIFSAIVKQELLRLIKLEQQEASKMDKGK